MARRRCRYGKLKHKVGGRICRRKPARGKKARRSRRRMKRGTKLGIGLGTLAVLGIGAAIIIPQLTSGA